MSAAIKTPIVAIELEAAVQPLPESHPESPMSVTATSCVNISEPELLPSILVHSPEADEVTIVDSVEHVESDADSAIGSNKSRCGSSCNSTASADAVAENIEQGAADKIDSDSIKSGSANSPKTVIGVDENDSGHGVTGIKASSPDCHLKAKVEAVKDEGAATERGEDSIDSANAKLMDPNDTKNKGNVAKTFFTSEVEAQSRSPSPIHVHGNVNLKFSKMADLYVKATDADGRCHISQVHSATLEAASTVFYSMIYKSNTRGNKEEWVWELDDSAIGLKVMFSLLHLNYRAALFTQEPTSHQVYEVLRVLAKYNISDGAFQPFVKSWVVGFRKGLDETSLSQLECLYTAHKLGDFKSLKVSIRKVAHEVELSEDGTILFDKQPIQEVVPISDELVANIRAVRGMDLKNILDPLKDAYEALMGDTNDQHPADFCKSQDGHDECNEKLLGSLLGNLRRQKLRPVPTPAAYTGSVGALADKVSQMDIRGLIVPNLEPHKQRHGRCKLGQDEFAKQLLECKAYLSIYDDLVEQMVLTAKRAGTSKYEKDEFDDYKEIFNKASIKYDEESRRNFWGWNEDADSMGSEPLFPRGDSRIGEENGFRERKVSADLAASDIGAA